MTSNPANTRRRHTIVLVMFGLAAAAGSLPMTAQVQPQGSTQGGAFGGLAPRDGQPASSPPVGTAEVAGTVVSADTGRPVRRATVRLSNSVVGSPSAMGRLDLLQLPLPAAARPAPGGPMVQTTDDQGTFRFRQLPAGEYTLSVSKPGYLTAAYGQKRAGSGAPGTAISLVSGQRLERLSVAIPRGSVLTGTIVDDVGEPAFGVQVRALRYVMRGGARVLEQAGTAQSDDRGIYRIPVLVPGQYVLMATPRDDSSALMDMAMKVEALRADIAEPAGISQQFVFRSSPSVERPADSAATSGYAPVYYPGSTMASAAVAVPLALGEERTALDLRLELVPLGRITGVVATSDGRSLTGVEVLMEDAAQALPGLGTRSTRVAPDGTFAFNGVPPARYTITARSGGRVQLALNGSAVRVTSMTMPVPPPAPPGSAPTPMLSFDQAAAREPSMWASAEAAVIGGNVPVSVNLRLQPALSVSGRVEFVGPSAPPSDLSRVRVGLASTGGGRADESAIGAMTTGREFTITGVVPGKYRPVVLGLPGWVPKSAQVAGRDILDFPLDVSDTDISGAVLTMVERMATLSGTLQDASGRPTANYTVIVAAEDSRYWTPQSRRIQSARPTTDGRFTFQNLPAGAYRLMALDDVEPDQWFDPEFLKQLVPASIAVTIGDGESKTQDVRIK